MVMQLAYRRQPGQTVTERLAHGPSVRLEVLRGRFSSRHARLLVRLVGEERSLQRTLREFTGRAVSVRIVG